MRLSVDEKICLGGESAIFHGTFDTEAIAAKRGVHHDLLRREAGFLRRFNHENVVKFRGFVESDTVSYLIMDLARDGNLQSQLGLKKFDKSQKQSFVRQISSGLDHIHSLNVLHRNITPKNILFKNANTLVISDFGLAQEFGINVPTLGAVPESEYTAKSDVYLLAVVAAQIFEDRKDVVRKAFVNSIEIAAFEGAHMNIFDKESWKRAIMDAVHWKPALRPSAAEFGVAFKE